MATFDIDADTPAAVTDFAADDKIPYCDTSAHAWETILGNLVLEAFLRRAAGPLRYDGTSLQIAAPVIPAGSTTLNIGNGATLANFPGNASVAGNLALGPNLTVTGNGPTMWVPGTGNGATVRRTSDGQIGIRFFGHSGAQVRSNLWVGGNEAATDDSNARLKLANATNGVKVQMTGEAATVQAMSSASRLAWESGSTIAGAEDAWLGRVAAGVVGNASTWDHFAGHAMTTANVAIGNASVVPLTGLRINGLVSGRQYRFRLMLIANSTEIGEGSNITFGGTSNVSVSQFAATGWDVGATQLSGYSPISVFTDPIDVAPPDSDYTMFAEGTFVTSSAGNLTPAVAITVFSAATLTIKKGSYIEVVDIGP